jgi:cullin-associated NEDD8-dissociated protein 1
VIVTGLDSTVQPLDAVLKTKLKETAVKQEVEKLQEMQRSVLRTMAALLPLMSSTHAPRFVQLVNEVRSGPLYGADFKELLANAEHNRPSTNGADRMEID